MTAAAEKVKKRKTQKISKLIKWLLLSIGILILIILLLLGSIVGTEGGRTWLTEFAVDKINASGLAKIELDGFGFPTLGELRFGTLKVYQSEQLLLAVSQFELLWQPSELFSNRVVVEYIRSSAIDFYKPQTAPTQVETPEKTQTSKPKLVPIYINDLALGKVTLHGIELTEQHTLPPFSVNGHATLFDQHPVLLKLDVKTFADIPTTAKIESSAASISSIELNANITEPPNGLISQLLKLPEAQALDIQLQMGVQHQNNVFDIALEKLFLPIYEHEVTAQGNVFIDLPDNHYRTKNLSIVTDNRSHAIQASYQNGLASFDLGLNQFPLTLANPWVADLTTGELSTQLALTWSASYPGQFPQGEGTVSLNTNYKGLAIQLDSKQKLQYPLISLAQTNIRVQQAKLQASGQLDLKGKNNDLKLSLQNFNSAILAPFDLPIPEKLSARVPSLTAHITQSIETPNIALSASVLGEAADESFQASLTGKLTKKQAFLDNFDFQLADSTVKLDGLIDWTADKNDFRVAHKSIDNNIVKLAQAFADFDFPHEIKFTTTGKTQIKGALSKPVADTKTSVSGTFMLEGQAQPFQFDTRSDIAFTDMENWRFNSEQTTLVIQGKDVLRIKGSATPEAFNFNFNLVALPTELLSVAGLPAMNGQASADLTLSGSLDKPSMSGKIQYKDKIQVAKKQVDPLIWDVVISTPEQVMTLQSTVKQKQLEISQLTVTAPIQPILQAAKAQQVIPLDINIVGQQDLRVAKWFLDPAIHPVGGLIRSNLKIKGDAKAPDIEGWAKIEKAHYANTVSGIQLEDVNGDLKLEQRKLNIENLTAKTANDGKLFVEGFVLLKQPSSASEQIIDLVVEANDAVIVEQPGIQAQLSGSASAKGNLNDIWVKGRLELTPLNINIDEIDTTSVPKIKVTEVDDAKNANARQNRMPIIHLDIITETKQQAYLRGRGLETELGGEIKISGTASKPKYVGKFVTKRGKMELFGKKFILEDGSVQFANQAVGLNIPGVYTGKDITINLLISGTTETPKISLSSNPPLPEDEILSRIIFGKSAQNITPFQAIRLASAVKTLSQGGGFDPVDKAREKLGLDSINIENQDTESGSGLSVGVGKYINERVYLELVKTPDVNQPWAAAVQIEVSPRITVESTTGGQGQNNTKILWRKDY